ncbi:glycosyltransferase family 4 protein [Clostridium bowmanii]|uniref:glycosyltransferase family 4 protein n=1 Tax=Clostridium bowmanii TaxID=132925 RepID=UPI001C0E7D6A|nr:glycosyltransferase family 4 protein [Clostridium bowmanii]MBU3191233.1 glycosyltransferase family 4 protein [Clostridium bowmanii]MCA1075681.1 glycosyltransferase family 4 protein [Clostridium bowmanii]
MKILAVNKFYYIKGGSETYYFGLKEVLEKNGHTVIPLSMKDVKNFKNSYEKYFINNIEYMNTNFITKIKNAYKIIFNFNAKKNISMIIKDTNPDIAHLHIFQHQLSPSILYPLKKRNIPIAYTVHDLKSVCLNYKMFNSKGICEECKGKRYYKCFVNNCVKDSKLFSLVNVIEGYVHELLKSYDMIDMFITPSNFYREKLIEFGIPKEKVVHIPNFINASDFEPKYEFQDYFIYVGRLSEEKGISTLIRAMRNINKSKLIIVGTGPLEKELKDYVQRNSVKNVEFTGFKSGLELKELIRNSKFMVIPSEWYENGPMSMLECMAYGKAIIGADIAGIPELLVYENGVKFQSGNEVELSKKIMELLDDDSKCILMGKNGRKAVEENYNSNTHLIAIEKIYNKLLL